VSEFVQGAMMLGSFGVAVFFLRYWRDTGDRFFGVFALAFALFGVSRIALYALDADSETRTWVYALRAAAFLAILAAVVDKNLRQPPDPGERDERP
jgi:O-antigen/teichoic acid export membrane protein